MENFNKNDQERLYNEALIAARSVIELEDLTADFQRGVELIRDAGNVSGYVLNLIRET